MINPAQIRGARAMLNLTQAGLAELAGISPTALNSIEIGASDLKASTLRALQDALEARDIEFLNHGQPGVRLRAQASVMD
jgi:transcriptional regulator with XRE-family HTH domain